MNSQEIKDLKEGISRLLDSGATYGQIHDVLKSRGWGEGDIALVLDPALKVRRDRLSNPIKLVRDSFSFALSRAKNLSLVFLLGGIVSVLLYIGLYLTISFDGVERTFQIAREGALPEAVIIPIVTFGMLIIMFFFGTFQMVLPASIISGLSEVKKGPLDNIEAGLRRAAPLLIATLLLAAAVALGSILLIVPGVILGLWFFLAPIITVREETSPIGSFLASRRMVRGYELEVLVNIFVFALIACAFVLVCIGFITPLAYIDLLSFSVGLAVVFSVALLLLGIVFIFALFASSYYTLMYKELKDIGRVLSDAKKEGKVNTGLLVVLFMLIGSAVFLLSPHIKESFDDPDPNTSPVSNGQFAAPIQYEDGVMILGEEEISVALVSRRRDLTRGLSRQESIGDDQGLLFDFGNLSMHGIWMKDMNFAIDIIWLDEDWNVVDIKKDARPESFRSVYDAESFVSSSPARYVLEVASGLAERVGLEVGDKALLILEKNTGQ